MKSENIVGAFLATILLASSPGMVAAAPSIDKPQLYVAKTSVSRKGVGMIGGSKTRTSIDYMMLLPDGTVFHDRPDEGVATREGLDDQSRKKTGSWTIEGETLRLHFPDQRKSKQNFELTAWGAGWRLNEDTAFYPVVAPNPDVLKGIWQSSERTSGSAGIPGMGNPMTFVDTDEYTFRSERRFKLEERGRSTRYGTYEIDGYALILSFNDGAVERRTIFIWPFAQHSITIGANVLTKL